MLGLICAWFFPADLLHVYAVLYLLACLCLAMTPPRLLSLILGVVIIYAKLLALGLGKLDVAGELAGFWSVEARPPMPLFMLAGLSAASILLGVCLRSSAWLAERGILGWLLPAGRQTLTLYVLHVLAGMGLLHLAGLPEVASLDVVFPAALLFCWGAVVYARWWTLWSQRGLLEVVVRGV